MNAFFKLIVTHIKDKKNCSSFQQTNTEVEITCSEAIFALCFSTLMLKCLMKRLGKSALEYMAEIF